MNDTTRNGVRIGALAASLLVVACADVDDASFTAAEPRPASPTSDGSPSEPYLVGVNEFHWGETQSFGPRSYRMRFEFSQAGECDFAYALAGEDDVQGYRYAFFVLQDDDFFVRTSYSSEAIFVSSGPVDLTDEEEGTGETYTSNVFISGYDVSPERPLDIAIITRGNVPAAQLAAPGYSLAFSINCGGSPFDVAEARVGDYANLIAPINLDGTVAGFATTASATVASAAAAVPLDDGGMFILSSGTHAGIVSINHPEGEDQYVVTRTSTPEMSNLLREYASGPGDYVVDITRVGALPDVVLVAAYGFNRGLDMRLLLDQSALQ